MDVRTPEDNQEDEERSDTPSKINKKGLTRFYIAVEPIQFFLGFVVSYTNGVIIDVLERNICQLNFNITEDKCFEKLSPDMKARVEGMTADVYTIYQVVQGVFPVLMVMFVGPWSDTNGRKPFIYGPLIGYFIYFLTWAILSYFIYIPIWYYFIPSVLLGLSGTRICVNICLWSYICDNFNTEERPYRFSLCMAVGVVGRMIGCLLSASTVSWCEPYGYQVVFFVSSFMMLAGYIYAFFFIEETIIRPEGVPRTRVINFENIKNAVRDILIRPEKGAMLSALVMTILFAELTLSAGDIQILYLVGKTQYSWTLYTYNLLKVAENLMSALSPVFLVWLTKTVLEWSNDTLLTVGFGIFVVTEVLKALSYNQIMFWISTLSVRIASIAVLAMDTEASGLAPEKNSGKVFSLMSVIEALSSVISTPLYTFVYKLLLPNHTQYVFFISAVLATIGIIASLALFFKKDAISYTRQHNEI